MSKTTLEKKILEKLEEGLLDGLVGNDFETGDYATVTIRKVIKDGIPMILRIGPGSKVFDGKENIKSPGNVKKTAFKTIEEKLQFLQKYGWLLDDPDVKKYSKLFKPKR